MIIKASTILNRFRTDVSGYNHRTLILIIVKVFNFSSTFCALPVVDLKILRKSLQLYTRRQTHFQERFASNCKLANSFCRNFDRLFNFFLLCHSTRKHNKYLCTQKNLPEVSSSSYS